MEWLDEKGVGHRAYADPDRIGAGVLARVRERLGHDEVGGELETGRQLVCGVSQSEPNPGEDSQSDHDHQTTQHDDG